MHVRNLKIEKLLESEIPDLQSNMGALLYRDTLNYLEYLTQVFQKVYDTESAWIQQLWTRVLQCDSKRNCTPHVTFGCLLNLGARVAKQCSSVLVRPMKTLSSRIICIFWLLNSELMYRKTVFAITLPFWSRKN